MRTPARISGTASGQFDPGQHPQRRHADAARRLQQRRVVGLQAGDRVGQHRQDRVDDDADQRRLLADAQPDHQQRQQTDRRGRLAHVGDRHRHRGRPAEGLRRVSRMPSGMAMISTKNVEIAVSSTCCHRALDTCPFDSAFSEIASRSACWNHSQVASSTSDEHAGQERQLLPGQPRSRLRGRVRASALVGRSAPAPSPARPSRVGGSPVPASVEDRPSGGVLPPPPVSRSSHALLLGVRLMGARLLQLVLVLHGLQPVGLQEFVHGVHQRLHVDDAGVLAAPPGHRDPPALSVSTASSASRRVASRVTVSCTSVPGPRQRALGPHQVAAPQPLVRAALRSSSSISFVRAGAELVEDRPGAGRRR